MERSTALIAVPAALIAALGLVPKFTAFGVPPTKLGYYAKAEQSWAKKARLHCYSLL